MEFSADDEQALKQYLPSEFGKKDGSVNVEAQIERARRPVVDESKQAKKEKGSDDEKDSDDDDDSDVQDLGELQTFPGNTEECKLVLVVRSDLGKQKSIHPYSRTTLTDWQE